MNTNPKVFISYTHDNIDHADKILSFSNKLRSEGIDAIIDQYEESPPEGWPKWMDREIKNADYVLMVCTPTYYNRVMGYEKPGVGLGGIWEGSLIYQHLYNDGLINTKFIPILTDTSSVADIPTPLQGATRYRLNSETDYNKLYNRLRGIKATEKPALGKLRPLPEKERKTLLISSLIDVEIWDKAKWKGVAFIHTTDVTEPSKIILLFKNIEAGRKIISQWIETLGKYDNLNELRISFIEGDIPGEDYGYTVHIGSNWDSVFSRRKDEGIDLEEELLMIISRFNRMNPSNSKNLDLFKEKYSQFGSYFLTVGHFDEVTGKIGFNPREELQILKRHVCFRNVNDIKDENDIDAVILPKYRDKFNKKNK